MERTELSRIYPVSRETWARLERYRALLAVWQQKINLVAPDTVSQFWHRHVADSLQCLSLMPNAKDWLDVGSGAGFPGMVIAICRHQGAGRVDLVESNQRKSAFLRAVARETATSAEIHPIRIEMAAQKLPSPQIVTARALAPLPKLLELTAPWLKQGATGLFHKGAKSGQEIAEAHGRWQFDLVEHPSRTEQGSVLLQIDNLVEIIPAT